MKYSEYREQRREYDDRCAVNQYDDKSIWKFVNKYYMPEEPRADWRCKIGIHRYRGYNKYQMAAGGATQFYGRCTRCGRRKIGGWVERSF